MEHLIAFLMRYSKLLVAVMLIAAATYIYSQLPPSKIVIATGPKGGFFETSGEAYKGYLAKHGIEVELRGREDTLSIIDAVEDPKSGIDGGFAAQSIDQSRYTHVKSLGGIIYEPVFVFYRKELGLIHRLDQLKGRRLAVSPVGSGTRKMADELLHGYGVTDANATFLPLSLRETAAGLKSGAVDAGFLLFAASNAVVADLATNPDIEIMSYDDVEAISKAFKGFHPVKIPKGSYSLVNDIPDRDIYMPAVTTQFLVRKDLNPGIIYELLAAMEDAHGSATITSDQNEFPNAKDTQLPVHNVARDYYRDGLPFIFKHLPFYPASLIENTWIYVLPLVFLAPLLNLIGRLTVVFREFRRATWLRQLTEMHRLKSAGQQLTPRHHTRLAKIRQTLLGGGDTVEHCLRLLEELAGGLEHAAPPSRRPQASASLAIENKAGSASFVRANPGRSVTR
jgi:TRAP transporter TAXI family solute receptor